MFKVQVLSLHLQAMSPFAYFECIHYKHQLQYDSRVGPLDILPKLLEPCQKDIEKTSLIFQLTIFLGLWECASCMTISLPCSIF